MIQESNSQINVTFGEIQKVSADRYDEGYEAGHTVGKKEGYEEGFPQGMLQFYNAFFNSYLHSGYFSYTFAGTHWRDEIFAPNKDLEPIWICDLFTMSGIKDIVGCLNRLGRKLDTSKATYIFYIMRQNQKSKNLPFIDTSSCANLAYFLCDNSELETIEGIKFKDDGSQLFDPKYSFAKMPKLKEIKSIEGVIGQNGVDFSGSPLLSKRSYYSIFGTLSTVTQGLTITFSKSGVNETFRGKQTVSTGSIVKWYDDADGSVTDEWKELLNEYSNWNVVLKD